MAEIVIKLVNGELAGKTMQDINKQVSAANKELNKAKVGTDEFVKASEKLAHAKTLQADLKKQIDGTSAASDALKKSFGGVLNQIPGFSQLSGFLSETSKGVGGLTSKFGLFGLAWRATGIGLLLSIVAGLIAAFKSFTPLLDKVEVIMGGISAVISELIQRIQQFGSGLWDLITGNLDGLDKMASSFDGLAESMKAAYEAGAELAAMQQDLDDAMRGIALTNAKQSAQIDRILLQSKNLSLSLAERNKLLQDAKAIAEDNFKTNQDLDNKSLDLLLRKAAIESKLSKDEILQLAEGTLAQEIEYAKRGNLSDDLLEQIVAAQVKVIEGEGKNNVLLEKIINQESQIREKAEAQREKALREKEKREAEAAKAEEKRLKDLEAKQKQYNDAVRDLEDKRLAMMQDGREKDIAAVDVKLKREIESIDQNAPFYAERVAAAQDLARAQRDAINVKWDEKEKKDAEQRLQDELAKKLETIELETATEQNALNEKFLANQITAQQFAELSAKNAIAHKAQELELLKAAHGAESAEYQRAYGEYLSLQQAQADQAVATKKQEMKDQMAAMTGSLGTFANFFSTIANFQKQGTAQWKAFAVASAIMSTIQGAINAYTSTAAIPIVGAVLAPIAAGLALAAGYANVRKIQSTKPEAPAKAARGTVLRGPSHAQGGIPIEAEGDEIILTKGVYRNPRLRAIASDINAAAGGIRFEAGGPVNPFSAGSSSSGNPQRQQAEVNGASEILQVRDEIRELRREVAAWPTKLKVVNVVTDTEEGLRTINQIRSDADV